jgi:hypothetical protein
MSAAGRERARTLDYAATAADTLRILNRIGGVR